MKLIIKEYLASLKERDELDIILPDLLSQMGLNVFSRPGRGTAQNGVDVAAVGSIDGKPEAVYLFSIKSGDLDRASWDSGEQALRPSLNEIKDAYIPNKLPQEYKGKDIIVCLCFGGDIKENVQDKVNGYISNDTTGINYVRWNGDKLASLIEQYFLREDLMLDPLRSLLRKALSLLDEPQASFKHFTSLLDELFNLARNGDNKTKLRVLRQMSICLWILFAWARSGNNLESVYLAAERTLLLAWELVKSSASSEKKSKLAESELTFESIFSTYHRVSKAYIEGKIIPNTDIADGLSYAIQPTSSIDVNLKIFDVLGRLSTYGHWMMWKLQHGVLLL